MELFYDILLIFLIVLGFVGILGSMVVLIARLGYIKFYVDKNYPSANKVHGSQ